MQDIDGVLIADSGDSPPRVSVMRRHNFEHASPAKALERFGRGIGLSRLRGIESVANVDPDRTREGTKIPQ